MSSNFDHIAPYYHLFAKLVFGNSIHKAQLEFLNKIKPGAETLIIGGGSGRFLHDFLIKNSPVKVLYLERSEEMIRLSKEAIAGMPGSERVEFRTGTQADIKAEELFDVIITHCFLNIFSGEELRYVMHKLDSHLKPGGTWLFSDFRISGGSRFHRLWQKLLLRVMYLFFRITAGLKNSKLEDFSDLFGSTGLVKEEEKFFYTGMISAVCYKKAGRWKQEEWKHEIFSD